jgi:hypothetical protein
MFIRQSGSLKTGIVMVAICFSLMLVPMLADGQEQYPSKAIKVGYRNWAN